MPAKLNSTVRTMMPKSDRESVALPIRPFLFTIEQISVMLSVPEGTVMKQYIYYEGRSTGVRGLNYMLARNIAPPLANPVWRVAEREVVRWLKFKGFKIYEPRVNV